MPHLRLRARVAQCFALLSLAGLASCGGGGDSGICVTLSQSLVSATANAGSSIANGPQAADGNLGSFASLTPAAANGGGSFRNAIGQQNGGALAGVAVTTPSAGTLAVTVTTYLGNVQRETAQAGTATYGASASQACPGSCVDSGGQSYFGIRTSLPFDSFQAAITVSGSTSPVQVRELCLN